nr:transposase [uncultured Pseudoxanthomonas sp.]
MTSYRRAFIPGATYFFTANLADRRTTLLVDHIDLLRDAIRYTRHRHPFDIDALVVLPDHLHALWTLPAGDADFPLRCRLIKTWFSRQLPRVEHRRMSRVDKGERGIWQRRYWEHLIRDEVDFARHVDYIHWNPVKHGHTPRVVDWPYSTFHRFVRDGVLAEDWGWEGDDAGFGERR